MSIKCADKDKDDRETGTETNSGDQRPPAPDQATLDYAWAIAEASERSEWTTDLEPLSPLSLRFDELRDYARSIEWVDDEAYVYASKPAGVDPHPRHAIEADLWLTFDPVPEVHVRVRVM